MAARGRGGKTTSLSHEQLQAMGVTAKDAMPQVQTVPPPTYPVLLNKPTRTQSTEQEDQAILWKSKFFNHIHESPYYKSDSDDKKQNLSLGAWEKWAEVIMGPKRVVPEEYNWKCIPKELQIYHKKRKQKPERNLLAKKAKVQNTAQKLKVLEEKEQADHRSEIPAKTNATETDDDNEEEELIEDEEMDDENDYGNTYFDNGEAYNEEDDNLDDGPVY